MNQERRFTQARFVFPRAKPGKELLCGKNQKAPATDSDDDIPMASLAQKGSPVMPTGAREREVLRRIGEGNQCGGSG